MLNITGEDFRGNSLGSLGSIRHLTITGNLLSPAVQCRADLLPRQSRGEIGKFTITKGEVVLFTGRVDEQRRKHSVTGHSLLLEGRNQGRILLDNEALPGSLWGANLSTVFMRHLAPHGFALYQAPSQQKLPVFSIHKGMSLWEVFTRFCKRLYGLTPFVWDTQVMVKPLDWQADLVLSNSGAGRRFTQLEQVNSPYEIISDIVLRDEEGYYSTKVSNPTAPILGVKRRRYHIPTTEFVDHPRLDAHQRLQASLYASREWVVTLPEIVAVSVGTGVSIADELLNKNGLMVHEWRYEMSEAGSFTTLYLRESGYW